MSLDDEEAVRVGLGGGGRQSGETTSNPPRDRSSEDPVRVPTTKLVRDCMECRDLFP